MIKKVALIGNPNCGKSTLFNLLSGLNQHTGNFAGVTVEKKSAEISIQNTKIELIDLPGTYSIYPKSEDEKVVFNLLMDEKSPSYPDLAVVVVDTSNLERNLLLFTQVFDTGIPVLLVANMIDVSQNQGQEIDFKKLSQLFGEITIVPTDAGAEKGLEELKFAIIDNLKKPIINPFSFYQTEKYTNLIQKLSAFSKTKHPYRNLLYAHHNKTEQVNTLIKEEKFDSIKVQSNETIERYKKIEEIHKLVSKRIKSHSTKDYSSWVDKILMHKFWGYIILVTVFMLIFQAIFSWASIPMELIDAGITNLSYILKSNFKENILIDLVADGMLAGLGGILVFIPQIAFLFGFIALLEESGYMARVMFLMDNVMRPFGLNGRSIVPLFSGAACAIPAIMSARSISNRKERLITIFVTPLISCSARIPVYTIIIALVIPATPVFYFINYQGLALMAMYILGFFMALITALLLKYWVKSNEKSFFILEIPSYKIPKLKNVGILMYNKSRAFVVEAGKVIISISIILWFLSTYGPSKHKYSIAKSINLENSYVGLLGKTIEPAISPLGFDWKIGIAIITSFAAREVFVGTISTIYSADSGVDEETLKQKLALQKDRSGKTFFNFPRGMSMLVFYAFALQCMSTIAVVRKETKSWFIVTSQLIYLSILAYLGSFCTYSLLS
jgi:ferrous iron transport protein B